MNYSIKRNLKYLYTKLLSSYSVIPLLYVDYFRSYKKILNLSNPDTFGAKIQWMKKYGKLERYRDLVDKYKVRSYISNKIGDKYLTKLYGTYSNSCEINFEELPNKFVLKCNHGSGEVFICKDKNKIDQKKIKIRLNSWINIDYYNITREIQYKGIERKIICEEYLEDNSGTLRDYKIYCFDGNPKFIELDSDRYNNHTMDFYDLNWNKLDLEKVKHKNSLNIIQKPNNLDEMIEVAKKLSKGFPFIRVDLYSVNDKVYFGELTFTPANGASPFTNYKKEIEIAKLINLENYGDK